MNEENNPPPIQPSYGKAKRLVLIFAFLTLVAVGLWGLLSRSHTLLQSAHRIADTTRWDLPQGSASPDWVDYRWTTDGKRLAWVETSEKADPLRVFLYRLLPRFAAELKPTTTL